MAINGGVKFFTENEALESIGASITASTGSASEDFAIDNNPVTFWRSSGSDDTTTETLTLTLASSISFDRIFLVDHNFETFIIDYDDGGFTDFTTVVGLDGALGGGITETTFSDDTAYYEFDTVTTDTIRIRATTTQVVDAEKFLAQIVVTTELGTLEGFPVVEPVNSRTSKVRPTLSGKNIISKQKETFSVDLTFADYPSKSPYTDDLELMYTLFDREDKFLTWLCGGARGASKFTFTIRGFRLKDVVTTQITDVFAPSYNNNVYINPVSLIVRLGEHT